MTASAPRCSIRSLALGVVTFATTLIGSLELSPSCRADTPSRVTVPTPKRARPNRGWTPGKGSSAGRRTVTRLSSPGSLPGGELVARITAEDSSELKPPVKSGKHLTKHQNDLRRRWIDQGAMWSDHWSFQKPECSPARGERDPGLTGEACEVRISGPVRHRSGVGVPGIWREDGRHRVETFPAWPLARRTS